MIDPAVERQIADLTELTEAWRAFLEMCTTSFSNPSSITHEREEEFMEVKARIAMLHDSFLEAVARDRNVAQGMLAIVNRSITLGHLLRVSEADRKKIEIEWHESFLLLNETLSTLQEKKEEIAGINPTVHSIKRMIRRATGNSKTMARGPAFKVLIVLVVLAGVALAVPRVSGHSWRDMHLHPRFGAPVGKVYDFARARFGLDVPYSSAAAFQRQHLRADDWGGSGISFTGAETRLAQITDRLRGVQVEAGPGNVVGIADFLRDVSPDPALQAFNSTEGSVPGMMGAFWFQTPEVANRLNIALDMAGNQAVAHRRFNNVVVMVAHPNRDLATRILNEQF